MNALWISLAVFALVLALSGWAYRVNFPQRHCSFGDFAYKWLETIIVSGLCGIPTWLFLAGREFLNPEGFWQRLLVYCGGAFLVGCQLVCLLFLFLGICKAWEKPKS